ncbi:hypothetical protein GEV33_014056 [Tenebrio molitor]|uniref:Uncharacterized protein n=1 Tax=Tenebrio molitor TaxID=7067 RepID=A0A8J6H6D3_TENMO|nr:hypothetical protein GEV33_014056 [Tenebrio molitor]
MEGSYRALTLALAAFFCGGCGRAAHPKLHTGLLQVLLEHPTQPRNKLGGGIPRGGNERAGSRGLGSDSEACSEAGSELVLEVESEWECHCPLLALHVAFVTSVAWCWGCSRLLTRGLAAAGELGSARSPGTGIRRRHGLRGGYEERDWRSWLGASFLLRYEERTEFFRHRERFLSNFVPIHYNDMVV